MSNTGVTGPITLPRLLWQALGARGPVHPHLNCACVGLSSRCSLEDARTAGSQQHRAQLPIGTG